LPAQMQAQVSTVFKAEVDAFQKQGEAKERDQRKEFIPSKWDESINL
jgi:hypothetical protein